MAIKIKINRWGQATITGFMDSFIKYEKKIFSGQIQCPYKVSHMDCEGNEITNKPIKLHPSGKQKVLIFDKR